MPANLEFNKKDIDLNAKKYEVERVSGQAIETVEPGDTITFTRSGTDGALGFALHFKGDEAPNPVDAEDGKTSHTITAPDTKKVLVWKYTVSFPKDEAKGDKVRKYDPIIIINPGISSSLGKMVVTFAAGAIVAYLAVRFFPGLLG